MGHGRRRLLRNLWASLAVAATVAVIGVGLPAVNSLLPAARAVSAAESYAIAAGVSVRPPAGASIDVTQTQPGPRGGSVLFMVGTVRYAVVITPFTGSLADRGRPSAREDHRDAGLPGRRRRDRGDDGAGRDRPAGHVRVGRAGSVATPSSSRHGLSVEVTVAGSDTELPDALPAITASIRTLAFRTAS